MGLPSRPRQPWVTPSHPLLFPCSQGIFTGLYFGLGQGLGGLVGGLLMQRYGGQIMFALCGLITAAALGVLWGACALAELQERRRSFRHGSGGACDGLPYSLVQKAGWHAPGDRV